MKDEKRNKRKALGAGQQKNKVKKINPKHQQEQEQLFAQSDSISPANKKVDKSEFVELNNGEVINIDEYIRENYAEKATHFFKSFYFLIADLLGVSRDVMFPFIKPIIVPMLKKHLLYGRFPNAVQERLYKKNKYIGYYTRKYWNYQWLTKKADLILRGFITDFETEGGKVLAAGGNIKAFIKDYCKKFNIPIQPEIFE